MMVRRASLRSRQPRLRFSRNLNARFSSQSVPRLERNVAMCAALRCNQRQRVDPCLRMAGIPIGFTPCLQAQPPLKALKDWPERLCTLTGTC